MSEKQPIRVLLIEDHPADITLTRKAFTRISTPTRLDVVLDGMEAMRFLRRLGKFQKAERPHIILLDLNMPRMDGREFLRAVAEDADLRSIPIIVLTTSSSPVDVAAAYELNANSYVSKPVGFEDFLAVIAAIEHYWFNTALIPR